MASAVHYGDYELDTVTGSVTREAKCAKMRKYRSREELGSSPASVHFGVEDFSNFILKFTLNVDQRGQRLYMVRNLVWNGGFQHGNMEHGVHTTDGVQKTECIGMGSGFC